MIAASRISSRWTCALLWGALLGGLGAVRDARAQAIPVRAGAPASSLPGVDLHLPVMIDMSARSDKLGSLKLEVTWDPAVLEFQYGVDGAFGSLTVNETNAPSGSLMITGANPNGKDGIFSLGTAVLRPLSTASTTIQFTVHELYAAGSFADLTPDAAPVNAPYCNGIGRFGDINVDAAANSADALIALMNAVGLDVSSFNIALGDVDGDAATGTRDALLLLSWAVGLDVRSFRIMRVAPGPCAAPIDPLFLLHPGDQTLLAGQQVQYALRARDAGGAGGALTNVTWGTTDGSVASVNGQGLVTANGVGSAVISATEAGFVRGSATVTVVATRRHHWVDVGAANADHKIGTPAFPYDRIADALTAAENGDTIHVRSGRYDESLIIGKGVTIMGELGAAQRPLITGSPGATGDSSTAVTVNGGTRVELHRFRFDPQPIAVRVDTGAGSVLLRQIDFAQDSRSIATVFVPGAIDSLWIQQSRLVGAGAFAGLGGPGVWMPGSARMVRIDSSGFFEHGTDAIRLYVVDSLVLRGSRIADNYGYGVVACGLCPSGDTTKTTTLVASWNRIINNMDGAVYVDRYRNALFDHNVIVGGGGYYGYDAIQLLSTPGGGRVGPSAGFAPAPAAAGDTGFVSLLGDSISVEFSSWLSVFGFDSLAIDSVWVRARGFSGGESPPAEVSAGPTPTAQGPIEDGRVVTLTNSTFVDLTGNALQFDPRPGTGRLVLRNTDFRGPYPVVCCGYAIQTYETVVDADDVTADGIYSVFDVTMGSLTVRNSAFTRSYHAINTYCALTVVVDNSSFADGSFGVDAYGGCAPSPETISVTGSTFDRMDYGVMTGNMTTTVTNNVFTDIFDALDAFSGAVTAADNQITRANYSGFDIDGNGRGVTTLERNTISCAPGVTGSYGIELFDQELYVKSNTISDCFSGIKVNNVIRINELTAPVVAEIRNNSVTLPAAVGDYGIYAEGDALLGTVVKNTVNGAAKNGSIYVGGLSTTRKAIVDSNTVDGSIEAGIWGQFVDTLKIRDNVVTNHKASSCCVIHPSAAILVGNQVGGDTIDVRRNRITTSATNGIVLASGADPRLIRVDSNTVKNADSIGIWVSNADHTYIRWNAIDGSKLDAVLVSLVLADSSALATSNNFTGSTRFGLNNTSVFVVSAINNWWNDPLGPKCGGCNPASTGEQVSANVTYSPFLTSASPIVPVPSSPAVSGAGGPARARSLPMPTRAVRAPAPGPMQVRPVVVPLRSVPAFVPASARSLVMARNELLRQRALARVERAAIREQRRATDARPGGTP